MVSIQCTINDKKAFLITSLLGNYEFEYKKADDEEETTSSNHQYSNNNPSPTSNQYGAGTESYFPNQDNSYGLSTLNISSPQLDAKASVHQVLDPAPSKPAGQYYPSNPYPLGGTSFMSASGWSANGEYPGSSGTYNSGLPSRKQLSRSHSEPAYQTVSLPCPIGEIFNGLPLLGARADPDKSSEA
jgi:hypothetical protein